MSRGLAWLIGPLLALAACLPASAAAPSIAFFYGKDAPLDELRAFDIAVVEPDHGYDPQAYRSPCCELFAYVSVGEVQPSRPWFKDLPQAWKLGANTAWGSVVVDQAQPAWPAFLAERVVGPLWAKGYRGFFLDTLDSYRLAGDRVDAGRQQQGLIAVVRELRRRFPGIRLIANRGFEILPELRQDFVAVAAESLFRGWDEGAKRYVEVAPQDREWLLARLKEVRDGLGLPVVAIDYVAPGQRALARETAARIRELGFVPWVADGPLTGLGLGELEVMPRKVLLLYDGREAAAHETMAHRFLAMPLNHLGYVPEYLDVNQGLPQAPLPGRYAGIVTWFAGGVPGPSAAKLATWLRSQRDQGMPVAVLGDFGYALDAAGAAQLGLEAVAAPAAGRLTVARREAPIGFESEPLPDRRALVPLRLKDGQGRSLLTLADVRGQRFDAAAIMPWGGFVLNPFALFVLPGTEGQARWVIDPFVFLEQALRLPPMPVPDTTTESGRRLMVVHIDGDGFPSRAEMPGTPLAAQVLLHEILERYRVPTAMSLIEAEVSRQGLHPDIAPQMEEIARRMFRLPHVEAATHTYSHPFDWARAEGRQGAGATSAYYALEVPGYTVDIEREIAGSADYVRGLVPPGKKVELLHWSGDAAPGERSLALAQAAGLLNLNGGNTMIRRAWPTVTAVWPLGIPKGAHFQTYAPVVNENVYTNLWHGPFYGYEKVIETFEMTEKPRRLKPIGIYFHTYSASKPASLNALHKVFGWALARQPHPVFATEYVRKVLDFNRMTVARRSGPEGEAWLIRGAGELRTLRLPDSLGMPDVAASTGVVGYTQAAEGRYVHLASGEGWLRTAARAPAAPQLAQANARVKAWRRTDAGFDLDLAGHVALEFSLRAVRGCRVAAAGKALAPYKVSDDLSFFRLRDADSAIQVSCGRG